MEVILNDGHIYLVIFIMWDPQNLVGKFPFNKTYDDVTKFD